MFINGITIRNGTGTLDNFEGGQVEHGGGLFIKNCFNVTISNAVIKNNHLQSNNNTITKNRATGSNSALYSDSDDDYVFVNSILWNDGWNEFFKRENGLNSSMTFSNSNIRGLESNFVSNGLITTDWLTDNLDVTPLFIDKNNDNFNLADDSPLLNAGTTFFELNGVTLLDLNSTDYCGFAPEIGAYENQSVLNVDNELIVD